MLRMLQETTPLLGAPLVMGTPLPSVHKPAPPLELLDETEDPPPRGLNVLAAAANWSFDKPEHPRDFNLGRLADMAIGHDQLPVAATDDGECWRFDGPLPLAVLQQLMQKPDRVRPEILRSSAAGAIFIERTHRRSAGRPKAGTTRDSWVTTGGRKHRSTQSEPVLPFDCVYGFLVRSSGERVRYTKYMDKVRQVSVFHLMPTCRRRERVSVYDLPTKRSKTKGQPLPPVEPESAPRAVVVRSAGELKGNGVFATTVLSPRDELGLEYTGTHYDQEEGNNRFDAFSAEHPGDAKFDPEYTVMLPDGDFIESTAPHCIAATVNHDINANCKLEWSEKKLWVKVLQKIMPGEELTIDYGPHWLGFDRRSRFYKHFERGTLEFDWSFTLPAYEEFV